MSQLSCEKKQCGEEKTSPCTGNLSLEPLAASALCPQPPVGRRANRYAGDRSTIIIIWGKIGIGIRSGSCLPREGGFIMWNLQYEKILCYFSFLNMKKKKCVYCLGRMQRLPPKNVYYYRCPDHRKNYVMSFAFCFDREEDIYQFAYCYPYTYTRFQHYLDGLQKRNMDYFFREQLGQSVRPEGRKPSEVAHKSIEAVVARLEKQNGLSLGHGTCPEEVFVEASPGTEDMDSLEDAVVPRALYEELLRNYQQQQEEMRHLQQELERTRRQLVQQAKKLKEYGALMSEMKELRDLNRRLQDVLLLRLGSGPAIDLEKVKSECLEPEPELRSTFSEEANTSSYYPAPAPVMDKYILDNGKVHLGSGIWVDEEKWHQLQVTQGDSKYTKNLAVMIWGTDVLKNRSVTGVATKKKKDAVPKPPLSPHKLSIVRECLYDRIAQETVDETEIAQRLSKVNKYICEKIMDINKSCKNEERREAKYNLQ
ncbi:unnamed protein product [Nyctereutes procyonoides]|uniref:BEN domain-containing protein 5 n=2 Tax=Nyctereutes procyonoides TaxID=34880 RepID=A0A811Z7B4_NYCPR|nr:unnamed protein product [Nyctereutes procyonoides]